MPMSLNALTCAGDYLRIWQLKENGTHLIKLLNNVRAVSALISNSKYIPSGKCKYHHAIWPSCI